MYNHSQASKYWEDRIKENSDNLNSVLYFAENDYVNNYYDYWEKAIVSEWLKKFEGTRVLDLPVGIGRYCNFFATKNTLVNAVDISDDILDIAKKKVPDESILNFDFTKAYSSNLPFPNEHFDLILCTGLFEHLPTSEYIKTIEEFSEKMKKGGFLILVINNSNNSYLKSSKDNKYRKSIQLENGYFGGITDLEKVILSLESNNIIIENAAINPSFSLLRKVSKGINDHNILIELYKKSVEHDLKYYKGLENIINKFSDQIMLLGRKKNEV